MYWFIIFFLFSLVILVQTNINCQNSLSIFSLLHIVSVLILKRRALSECTFVPSPGSWWWGHGPCNTAPSWSGETPGPICTPGSPSSPGSSETGSVRPPVQRITVIISLLSHSFHKSINTVLHYCQYHFVFFFVS